MIIKCKMCGGDLESVDGEKILKCQYCSTAQTLPTSDDEKILKIFNRANRLRMANEFDKAAALYESIIIENPEDSEAYWGLCLCNYGIEYVDDPATGDKIPTCHRASLTRVQRDENYNMAIEYADLSAQKLYRDEARKIDEIMENILLISKNEKSYDIFICYKETDEIGDRTEDSVLAEELYDALTDKGYKVFFSRVTLEDKLGMQYEPYIFAALNSAKIMLVVGTKYEYYHAPWVKNEWARFVKMMTSDKTKVLIPCYKRMDPYDLPDELKGFQSQDMGKLGYVQDIVRGIKKLLYSDEEIIETKRVTDDKMFEPLLKRIAIFLEDANYVRAKEYCEKVLDQDPENPHAYYYMILAENYISDDEQLTETVGERTLSDKNFVRALKFSTGELREKLLKIKRDIENTTRITNIKNALETENFEKVKDYCEQILDQDPEDGYAYFYMMMAENHISSEESVYDFAKEELLSDRNFSRAFKFSTGSLRARLVALEETIKKEISDGRELGRKLKSILNEDSRYTTANQIYKEIVCIKAEESFEYKRFMKEMEELILVEKYYGNQKKKALELIQNFVGKEY